jgi:hypothetical protein
MSFIGAQLGVGEIGVGSFRQSAVAKRREAMLNAKAGSTRMAVSRPRPSRTIFREGPLLAQSGESRAFTLLAAERTCHTGGLRSPFGPNSDISTYAIPIIGW